VNILKQRVSDFEVQDWIMDSGAFTELARHGAFTFPVDEYARAIERWAGCGNLEMAVTQDYMCEPFMLERTGMAAREHQELTIRRYDQLLRLSPVPIMPVLQGYQPEEYITHLGMYGARLTEGMRVGVGSICKRNSNPRAIVDVLHGIKRERPDLRLHGFGLKTTALHNAYIVSLLHSADSMAWSYAARREGRDPNGLAEATGFRDKVQIGLARKSHQLEFVA